MPGSRKPPGIAGHGWQAECRPGGLRVVDVVRSRNVYRWAGQMLLAAAQLRKRRKIMRMSCSSSARRPVACCPIPRDRADGLGRTRGDPSFAA
jgi:hypothetical protein